MKRNHSQTIQTIAVTSAVLAAVVLAFAPSGWAATETVIYSFQNRTDGYSPVGVIMVDGSLYGTTATGGAYDSGTVFELVHSKSGWVKNTLHEFTGGAGGWNPIVGLVADKSGHIYGGAAAQILGGVPGAIVFEISRDSGGERRFGMIYVFTGYGPSALTIDDAGALYGVTSSGGGRGCAFEKGCGTVFKLSPGPNGDWVLTTLHRFGGDDGEDPQAPLLRDAHGNLYGTTQMGGGPECPNKNTGCGTAFELSPSGKGWKFAVLHRFDGTDGWGPMGPLAMDSAGNLYGTTGSFTGSDNGLVYKLSDGRTGWKETVLYKFSGPPDASGPTDGVVFGSDGEMYGTAVQGGAFYEGAIFELERSGKGWLESVPFSFDVSDGFDPGSLISGGDGKYYGTTWGGGNGNCEGPGCGVVFEFVP